MNGGTRVAALIPARAGSKGIPNKNLAELGGRSLLRWAIDLATATPEIDRCIVSTDGEDIAEEGAALGAEIHRRPVELAGDDSLVSDTVVDVLTWHGSRGEACEQFVLLQPTSPFRDVGQVRRCLAELSAGADSAATFSPAALHPHRAFRLADGEPHPFVPGAVPWVPRQALEPAAFQLSGSVYAFWAERLEPGSPSLLFGAARAVLTEGPVVDIDEEIDLRMARLLLEAGVFRPQPQRVGGPVDGR
jgi:CMP-N-acetylneuraminic acid synthetase